MNDPLEIPEHIRKAAATVEIFFKVNGINEWALMGIQSRRSEPAPTPNSELKNYSDEFIDSVVRQAITNERAARERVERALEILQRDTEAGRDDSQLLALSHELAALKLKTEKLQDDLFNIGRKTGLWWAHKAAETADEVKKLKLKLEVAKGEFERLDNTFSYDVCKSIVRKALAQLNESGKLPEEPCSECRIIGRKNCSEHGPLWTDGESEEKK